MPVAPIESVYQAGPDDSLRVVDIYGEGEVLAAFEAASETVYVEPDEENEVTANEEDSEIAEVAEAKKAAAVQNLKTAMASGEGDISSEQLLSLDLSDAQLNSFVSAPVPATVDKKKLLQENPTMGVNELSETLKAVQATQTAKEYNALSQEELQEAIRTHSDALTGLIRGYLGIGTELKELGIKLTDLRLDILKKLNAAGPKAKAAIKLKAITGASKVVSSLPNAAQEFIETVDEDDRFTDKEKTHIKKAAASNAADKGHVKFVAEIALNLGKEMSPELRRKNLLKTLKNYTLPDNPKQSEYKSMGYELWESLLTIDYDALSKKRDDYAKYDASLFKDASDASLAVLGENPASRWVAAAIRFMDPKARESTEAVSKTLESII